MLLGIDLAGLATPGGLADSRDTVDSDDSAVPCELFRLSIVAEVGDPANPCELAVLDIVVELDERAMD